MKSQNISKNNNPLTTDKNLTHRYWPNSLTLLMLLERHLKSRRPSLTSKTKKIEIVQKIISDQDKPKPKISMTTKGLWYKQVIVLIKGDNANNFIKDSSMHVININ